MADDGNDQSWIAELESALKEDGSVDIGNGPEDPFIPDPLRPEIWKSCLTLSHRKPPYFDDIFDLPEQKIIREDCHHFVDSLGNAEEEKLSVVSDVECLVSTYCRNTGLKYSRGNGWLDLLAPLLALGLHTEETYSLFEGLRSRYVPRSYGELSASFRLLLLYHDPHLCSFLDTKKISPEAYATTWFQTLFAGPCCLPVITKMWDLYFQQADPFFILFLALVMIINAREHILTMKESSKDSICETITSLPSGLQETDVEDLFSLAQEYASRTPGSFRQDLESIFDDEEVGYDSEKVSQALCLPVHVSELVENLHLPPALGEDALRFFLVDCRPADQYNAGHMPTAFHLDPTLMLQGGGVYKMAVQGLLSAQRQALDAGSSAGGEHLCFIGCGALHEDQYTHMVVAGFLRDYRPYVSILSGGYHALHDYFGDNIEETLADHSNESCRVCVEYKSRRGSQFSGSSNGNNTSPSKDIFGKIGAVMKSKSAEVKDKLLEYIVNPTGANSNERHVSPNDRRGKRYRGGATVFTIDDSPTVPDTVFGGDEDEDVSQFETVTLSEWRTRPDLLASFDCTEIKMNGQTYDSELFVSESHVYVVRKGSRGRGELVVKKPLSAIAKITSKKRTPEVITFKYGSSHGDSIVINDMDRFVIPRANEATSMISRLIVKILEKKEEESPGSQ